MQTSVMKLNHIKSDLDIAPRLILIIRIGSIFLVYKAFEEHNFFNIFIDGLGYHTVGPSRLKHVSIISLWSNVFKFGISLWTHSVYSLFVCESFLVFLKKCPIGITPNIWCRYVTVDKTCLSSFHFDGLSRVKDIFPYSENGNTLMKWP